MKTLALSLILVLGPVQSFAGDNPADLSQEENILLDDSPKSRMVRLTSSGVLSVTSLTVAETLKDTESKEFKQATGKAKLERIKTLLETSIAEERSVLERLRDKDTVKHWSPKERAILADIVANSDFRYRSNLEIMIGEDNNWDSIKDMKPDAVRESIERDLKLLDELTHRGEGSVHLRELIVESLEHRSQEMHRLVRLLKNPENYADFAKDMENLVKEIERSRLSHPRFRPAKTHLVTHTPANLDTRVFADGHYAEPKHYTTAELESVIPERRTQIELERALAIAEKEAGVFKPSKGVYACRALAILGGIYAASELKEIIIDSIKDQKKSSKRTGSLDNDDRIEFCNNGEDSAIYAGASEKESQEESSDSQSQASSAQKALVR